MYQFTEDCITGIREIDQQHEKLFELINEILELLQNNILQDKHHQVQNILEELKEYADIHFVSEEAYMAAINDPELEIQKKQHMVFRERINSMDFMGIDEIDAQHELLEELMRYLTRWLYHHILSSD